MNNIRTKPFELNWPHGYVTRDGRPARIICTDRVGADPILVLVANESGIEAVYSFNEKGLYSDSPRHDRDLLCVVPKPEPRAWWIVLDIDGHAMAIRDSKSIADSIAELGRDRSVIQVREVLPEDDTP